MKRQLIALAVAALLTACQSSEPQGLLEPGAPEGAEPGGPDIEKASALGDKLDPQKVGAIQQPTGPQLPQTAGQQAQAAASAVSALLPDISIQSAVLTMQADCSHKWAIQLKNIRTETNSGLSLVVQEKLSTGQWSTVKTVAPLSISAGAVSSQSVVWSRALTANRARFYVEKSGAKINESGEELLPQINGSISIPSIAFTDLGCYSYTFAGTYSNSGARLCEVKLAAYMHHTGQPDSSWSSTTGESTRAAEVGSNTFRADFSPGSGAIDQFKFNVLARKDPAAQFELLASKTVAFQAAQVPDAGTNFTISNVTLTPQTGNVCHDKYTWSAAVRNDNAEPSVGVLTYLLQRVDSVWIMSGGLGTWLDPGASATRSGEATISHKADTFKIGVGADHKCLLKESAAMSISSSSVSASVTELTVSRSGADYATWTATVKNTSSKKLCGVYLKAYHATETGSWVLASWQTIGDMGSNTTSTKTGSFVPGSSTRFKVEVYVRDDRLVIDRWSAF